MEREKDFYFPLPVLHTKHLCRCQTYEIFFVVVILAMMMVAVTIIALTTLDALTVSLLPRKIYI